MQVLLFQYDLSLPVPQFSKTRSGALPASYRVPAKTVLPPVSPAPALLTSCRSLACLAAPIRSRGARCLPLRFWPVKPLFSLLRHCRLSNCLLALPPASCFRPPPRRVNSSRGRGFYSSPPTASSACAIFFSACRKRASNCVPGRLQPSGARSTPVPSGRQEILAPAPNSTR